MKGVRDLRKKVLFVSLLFLLTLILLPTASVVAPGPEPKEQANVTVVGDISTNGVVTLNIRRAGKLVILYGPADLEGKEFEGIELGAFEDGHQLGIRIDKRTGVTEIIYNFGTKDFEGKTVSKYQLTGPGTWSDGSIPYGTVTVTEENFIIYEMSFEHASKKKGKGAIGGTYVEDGRATLSFKISITPLP